MTDAPMTSAARNGVVAGVSANPVIWLSKFWANAFAVDRIEFGAVVDLDRHENGLHLGPSELVDVGRF